jgi:CheY-like chemotaxis protein
MEAVGQLTGGIAHDFNNMLAVVIGSLNLLKRRLQRGEGDNMRFVDGALDGAERAATLTHRLLAFSRQQPLAPQAVDLNKLIAGMSEMLRRTLGEQIAVETVLAGGLWRTHADPGQLESAILNLAVNSRDAMPAGGRLTIESANSSLDEAYSALHVDVPSGQYVLLAVTDTGQGMPPDVVAKAFEPFFTTKGVGKGTGLGLSQVLGFVKQSGGHVKIYSEPNHGTTVKIYLPRFNDIANEVPYAAPPAKEAPGGQRHEVVLVVEDEERMLQLSCDAFRELGYTVLQAAGPMAALRIIDAHPEITLLFTDVVMPEMTGRLLAREAVLRLPKLKVLFTTGFSRNAVIHNGVLDQDVNFISKPFTIEQLAAKVRVVLGGMAS